MPIFEPFSPSVHPRRAGRAAAAAVFGLAASVAAVGCGRESGGGAAAPATSPAPAAAAPLPSGRPGGFTYAQYEAIRKGMKPDEVEAILGTPGVYAQSTPQKMGDGRDMRSVTWQNAGPGGSVSVIFINGLVAEASAYNLPRPRVTKAEVDAAQADYDAAFKAAAERFATTPDGKPIANEVASTKAALDAVPGTDQPGRTMANMKYENANAFFRRKASEFAGPDLTGRYDKLNDLRQRWDGKD